MNKLLSSLLCLFVLLGGISAASAQVRKAVQWQEFASAEGRFRVALLSAPEQTVKDTIVEGDVVKNYKIRSSFMELYVGVAYCDHPSYKAIPDGDHRLLFYDVMRDLYIGSLPNAKLISQREFRYAGKTGREWTIKILGEVNIRYRMWLVDERLYQIVATYASAKQNDAPTQRRIDRFMDSFQVIGQQQAR